MRHTASTRMINVSGCLLAGLWFAACGSSASGDSTGTLVVPFELGNNRTCDMLGVKTVRAELDDKSHTAEVPCANGQVRFQDIPAGSYSLQMFGVDASGVEIMDSFTSGDVTVNVPGDDNTVVNHPSITLTAAPAHLLVRWNFGFGTCKGVGIDRFMIKVWRGSGDALLLNETLDCTQEGDGVDQYRSVDDADRRFSGDDAGEISVQPLDKTSINVGSAVTFNYSAPGSGHDVKISLTCTDGACTGSGKPD
jgi:hypothetical protein